MSVDKASFGGVILALGGTSRRASARGRQRGADLQPTADDRIRRYARSGHAAVSVACRSAGLRSDLDRYFLTQAKIQQAANHEIVGYAQKARREGIVSLEAEFAKIQDPFLKRSLMLAVDGTEPQELRKMMELELDNRAEHEEQIPKVFESADEASLLPWESLARSWD